MRTSADAAALRAVITYKALKGLVQLLLAVGLTASLVLGGGHAIREWAHEFRFHSTRAWAVFLSRTLEKATTPRGLHITLAALWLDGAVTEVEAWALHHRRPWGPWLVVAVTGLLLPFELVELARHVTVSRVLVLIVNAALVAFLVWHARTQARALPGGGAVPSGDGSGGQLRAPAEGQSGASAPGPERPSSGSSTLDA